MSGYKQVPEHIIDEIKELNGQEFRIGVSRVLSIGDIENGKMAHLGVSAVLGVVQASSPFLSMGITRWSKRNRLGQEIVRHDWPKRTRTWMTTSPNFGDAARYGTSSHMHSRQVPAKQTLHGKAFAFDISASGRMDGKYVVQALLEPVFPSSVDVASPDLLMAVSLTKEVIGMPHVFALGGTANNWSSSQEFDWEFLPVDHTGFVVDSDSAADTIGIPRGSNMRDTFKERYSAIRDLKPQSVRYGSTGFSRYVAFEFDKAVVLENYYYGNAAYVMYEDWQALSQRTRLDLLSDSSAKFERVIHSQGWQRKLRQAIRGNRGLTA